MNLDAVGCVSSRAFYTPVILFSFLLRVQICSSCSELSLSYRILSLSSYHTCPEIVRGMDCGVENGCFAWKPLENTIYNAPHVKPIFCGQPPRRSPLLKVIQSCARSFFIPFRFSFFFKSTVDSQQKTINPLKLNSAPLSIQAPLNPPLKQRMKPQRVDRSVRLLFPH